MIMLGAYNILYM